MFRIRKIYDCTLWVNQRAVTQVQTILRNQFPDLSAKKIDKIPDQLRNPLKHRFKTVLLVAEDSFGSVRGFALLSYAPDLNFCYLDYIATQKERSGGGIGGALYERVRLETLSLNCIGLFFELLPDDPTLCRNPVTLKQNKARVRFYERYGARPIVNTRYETPLSPLDDNPPYLVFDPLGRDVLLGRDTARKIVRAILERKYADECPLDYVQMVVDSFMDDPVKIREPRYYREESVIPVHALIHDDEKIFLVVNEKHELHHVRARGYVESPVRVGTILAEIERTELFHRAVSRAFSENYIKQVHDNRFIDYLKKLADTLPSDKSVYPYVFPIRNAARPPRELAVRAGYFCIDTFTPISRVTYLAAKGAVDCALTAAFEILRGRRIAYALVRPPGHHAEYRTFGGFCYFNSAAVAAQYLSVHGRVAMLDVDFHHGNGQQDIFFSRSDVLTISIHGHPNFAYPYFSGFRDEIGERNGEGYNINYPLAEDIDSHVYREMLEKALKQIARFRPEFLIVLLGLDTARGDPTGSWNLRARDFERNGEIIGELDLPTLVVQEGGYSTRVLGSNARHFFQGLWKGAFGR